MKKRLPSLQSGADLSFSEASAPTTPVATWSEVGAAFGQKAIETKTVNLDMATSEGRRNRGRMSEMLKDYMRKTAEQSVTRNGLIPKVAMRTTDGLRREIPERLAGRAEHKGFRVAARPKGRRLTPGETFSGHTHMGEPYDWQKASCPGCRSEA